MVHVVLTQAMVSWVHPGHHTQHPPGCPCCCPNPVMSAPHLPLLQRHTAFYSSACPHPWPAGSPSFASCSLCLDLRFSDGHAHTERLEILFESRF